MEMTMAKTDPSYNTLEEQGSQWTPDEIRRIAERESRPSIIAQSIVPATPMEMLARAVQMGAVPETLERLMGLAERWERHAARKAYDAAMTAAKAAIPAITKNRTMDRGGVAGSWKYEDLAAIEDVVKEPLAKNGLNYRWRTKALDKGGLEVTCVITHKDGHSEETSLPGGPDISGGKNAIQAIGSTVTYLQRYTLKAALGLAVSNDDNTAAASPAKEYLTEEQVDQLGEAIAFKGRNIDAFCKYAKIDNLSHLEKSRFDAAMKFVAGWRAPKEG